MPRKMNEPKCSRCKWWDRQGDTWGECQGVDQSNGHSMRYIGIAKDKAIIHSHAADDSGMEVAFKTGEDFGCVFFEPRG